MIKITDDKQEVKGIEEIVSETKPLKAKNDDYDDSDAIYKRRNDKASDDNLKFL